MKYNTIIDSETINTFAECIENESVKLNEMIDKMLLLSQNMEKFFNTPTGIVMKDSLIEYLNNSKKTCESFGVYGTKLKKLNGLYYLTDDQIKSEVRAGD